MTDLLNQRYAISLVSAANLYLRRQRKEGEQPVRCEEADKTTQFLA
jgi:hypothetical protein